MSLLNFLILIGLSLAVFVLCRFERTRRLREPILLVSSVVVIFWLQPSLPIRGLDFWLPIATVVLTVMGWVYTSKPEERERRPTLITVGLITAAVLLVALTRFFSFKGILTPSRPPQTITVIIVLTACAVFAWLISRIKKFSPGFLSLAVVDVILIFVALKLPQVTEWFSVLLRGMTDQPQSMASALDIRWLGFSYIAFRLIHTLRDRQSGRLPRMTLSEYFVFILFFPAVSAGPIDRADRFIKDLRLPFQPNAEVFGNSAKRLVLGLFKKFVVADALAMIALNNTNAAQVTSAGWAWILLYAYSFQIFFDFSGYTDIAIGMAGMMGVKLPENFNAPYRKTNLTLFWNNWHMSLTQWFRAYFFNPITRSLRSAKKPVPAWLVILITQVATFLLIGLWHGMTINFILWGCWHGLGLFIQNRYSDWARPFTQRLQQKPGLYKLVNVFNVLLTFHFVALGWVWFALPSVSSSLNVFTKLFGAGG